jgi:Spy/CpxP family protein refolding chaperone
MIIVFVLVLVIWSLKWIWPWHRYDHHRWGGHHWIELSETEIEERVERGASWTFKKLDTTDEQEEDIEEALEELVPVIVDLRDEHVELRNRFRDALERTKLDREEMGGLLEEGKTLMTRSLDVGLETFIEIWEVLAPEQREEVLEHWDKKDRR